MAIEPYGANKNENNEMKMFNQGVMILFAQLLYVLDPFCARYIPMKTGERSYFISTTHRFNITFGMRVASLYQ